MSGAGRARSYARKWVGVGLGLSSLIAVWSGCRRPQTIAPRVEVGVFYGGQVQHLERVEVDRARPPTLGFRVHLPSARSEPKTITYEVISVGPAGRRVAYRQTIQVPVDRAQIDQVIPVPGEARLGLWNVRVTEEARILADRALYLVERGGN